LWRDIDMPELASPLVTAIVAVFSVLIGARLTEGRTYREKNWDRKAVAYSDVFEAIGTIERVLTEWYEEYVEQREDNEIKSENDRLKYRDAQQKMLVTIWRESWSLPEAVVSRLERLKKDLDERHESWMEKLDCSIFACRAATLDLQQLARADMVQTRNRLIVQTWLKK
jgi:hypothetical protein